MSWSKILKLKFKHNIYQLAIDKARYEIDYTTLRFTLQVPTIILSLLSKAVGACSFLGACVVWAPKQLLQERSVVNKINRMIKLW